MQKLFLCGGRLAGTRAIPEAVVHRLAAEAERHAQATISRSLEQNSRHFHEAREKLEKWADDMVLSAEKALADTKEQIKALRRPARQAVTLEEQHAIHRKARVRLPNRTLHAAMHVAVENQVAMGDALPVAKTLDRLLAEGLDRHDAVHAVASVLAEHMFNLMKHGQPAGTDPNHAYYQALSRLTAAGWRSSH